MEKSIVYEQPLNELMRVCLRLEYLFGQVQYHLAGQSIWDVRAAMAAIIDILNVVDRPDIKSKLTNALQLHFSTLQQLHQSQNVDKEKLNQLLKELDQSQQILHNIYGKIGQELRDNEFLSAIRQRLATPAGTCDFALPAYHLWLSIPLELQQKELTNWLATFKELQGIINLLLQLTRNSTLPKIRVAPGGFYQEALSPNIPYQMIRVGLKDNIYPDISVGKHRLSIYFYYFNSSNDRPSQVTKDVEFELIFCRL